jgi:hypothetical protein
MLERDLKNCSHFRTSQLLANPKRRVLVGGLGVGGRIIF